MCLFWTQRTIFWRKFVIRLFWGIIDFNSRRKILLRFPHSSEYLPLCSEQTHSYRFGSTWGRVKLTLVLRVTFQLRLDSNQHWTFLIKQILKWWRNSHFWVYCLFKSHEILDNVPCEARSDFWFELCSLEMLIRVVSSRSEMNKHSPEARRQQIISSSASDSLLFGSDTDIFRFGGSKNMLSFSDLWTSFTDIV